MQREDAADAPAEQCLLWLCMQPLPPLIARSLVATPLLVPFPHCGKAVIWVGEGIHQEVVLLGLEIEVDFYIQNTQVL